MKKFLAVLLVLCLILGVVSAALAAGAPKITKQPVSATTDKSGKVTFTIKVTNVKGITWKFINPANGEEITASNISKMFKGLKVSNPNGMKLVLKNVPKEMHNWSLYCHLTGNGYKVDSDIVQLKVYGMSDDEIPAAEPEAAPEPASAPEETAAPDPEIPAPAETAAPAANVPAEPEKKDSGKITVTVKGLILCPLDEKGSPIEDQQAESLTFDGSGSFSVRSETPVQYWVINGMQIEPAGDVRSFTMKNVTTDLEISAKAGVDKSVQYQVSCTGCTFTYLAGGLSNATAGVVPDGASIIVIADSDENAAKGYSINGKKAKHVGEKSFRVTISKDTTIVIP